MKTWSDIKQLSSGRLIASTSIWIFLVPAIVKVSNMFENASAESSPINLVAPYSFFLLYFSAVSFFLASIVYILRCPNFLKNNDNFTDFEGQGMSCLNLTESVSQLSERKASSLHELLKRDIQRATSKEIDNDISLTISYGKYSYSFAEANLSRTFWVIYQFHLGSRKGAQLLCWFLLIMGFMLLSGILVSNFLLVTQSM